MNETPEKRQNMWERTPQGRYELDMKFRQLVDMMEAYFHQAEFTPTEMREASLLAAIHYEYRQVRHLHGYTMSSQTAAHCHTMVNELFEAIQRDERPISRDYPHEITR